MARSLVCLVLFLLPAAAEPPECPANKFAAAGNAVESRFFVAPIERVREVVADSMQAIGVLLFEQGDAVLRGERSGDRVRAMRLPGGDEAVISSLEPSEQNGVRGTMVRVETRRRGSKGGSPKQSWSATVLDEAQCLLGLLRTEDPSRQTAPGKQGEREVFLPGGTPVVLVFRRFYYSTDLKVNQRLVLEVVSDVKVGEDIVIPRGAFAVARVKSVREKEEGQWGRSAQALFTVESIALAGGQKIAARHEEQVGGRSSRRLSHLAWDPWGEGYFSGSTFGLRAGTPLEVLTEKDERIRVPDRSVP